MEPNETPQIPSQLVSVTSPTQAIYADRIINVGIGTSVSRLTLALEVGENVVTPVAQVVIPTPALFEALEFMATSITRNDKIKKSIVDGLDAFKEKIAKTGE